MKGNALVGGTFEIDDRVIALAEISAPVLVFGGATDGIAPVPAVKAVVPMLAGSPEVRFEIVPGGHLGMLTGRAARGTTWKVMDEWITRWSTDAGEPDAASPGPTEPEIGTRKSRRHGSASSRALAP